MAACAAIWLRHRRTRTDAASAAAVGASGRWALWSRPPGCATWTWRLCRAAWCYSEAMRSSTRRNPDPSKCSAPPAPLQQKWLRAGACVAPVPHACICPLHSSASSLLRACQTYEAATEITTAGCSIARRCARRTRTASPCPSGYWRRSSCLHNRVTDDERLYIVHRRKTVK